MAWEWSHTAEGQHNVYLNLHNVDRDWLNECWAEIQTWRTEMAKDSSSSMFNGPFDDVVFFGYMKRAKATSRDCLINDIYDFAGSFATCCNGGFQAWVCPYGCHTISFDKPKYTKDSKGRFTRL